eukprot:12044289-Alexandrium_andersonii.AAC.1
MAERRHHFLMAVRAHQVPSPTSPGRRGFHPANDNHSTVLATPRRMTLLKMASPPGGRRGPWPLATDESR